MDNHHKSWLYEVFRTSNLKLVELRSLSKATMLLPCYLPVGKTINEYLGRYNALFLQQKPSILALVPSLAARLCGTAALWEIL